MDYREAKKRLLAAQQLLLEPSNSFEKFSAVRKLVFGIHPRIDEILHLCDAQLGALEKVISGDFLTLSMEHIPETTEEEKRHKKMLLVFWKFWDQLKGEITRVQAELDQANSSQDTTGKSSHWARVFNFAKGPFGIVTIAAVGLVIAAQATSVKVTIKNQGCATMVPSSSLPFSLPGLSFPKDPIVNGSEGVATVPALTFTIDGTQPGQLVAKALKLGITIKLGAIDDITLDGDSILGKMTVVRMGDKKTHDLVFICK